MSSIKHWILAIRPKTLVAAIIPIMSATALAVSMTSLARVDLLISVCILLSTLSLQIGTNLCNDAIDFHKGADTAERIGPRRVSQSGLIKPRTVLKIGFLFFAIAIVFGIPLVIVGGWPILLIGIFSILLGYGYTGGPYPLAYKGLGELGVFLLFGFLAVCGTYYLLLKNITFDCVILSLQIGALSSVILSLNNYRDIFTDRKAQKMTLAARFGVRFGRYEICLLFILAYLLNFYWLYKFGSIPFILSMLSIVFAFLVIKGIFRHLPSIEINKYLGLSALTELLFGLGLSFGLLLS